MTRWHLSISDKTDRLVRSHLARIGMKKGDLSKFVDTAVRKEIVRRTVQEVRKTLTFSKAKRYHRWMSWLSVTLYNFCRAHGSLKVKRDAQVRHRSPAMAARLADHIWTTREWLLYPILGG